MPKVQQISCVTSRKNRVNSNERGRGKQKRGRSKKQSQRKRKLHMTRKASSTNGRKDAIKKPFAMPLQTSKGSNRRRELTVSGERDRVELHERSGGWLLAVLDQHYRVPRRARLHLQRLGQAASGHAGFKKNVS